MGKIHHTAECRRALIAGAAACLLLLQTFASILSPTGRAVFANGVPGAVLSMAGDLCETDAHDGGKPPAQHHHQHCTLCVANARDLSLDAAVVLIATAIVLALPQSGAAPAWVGGNDVTPSLPGWASSWSSRAPPSFS